MNIITGSPSLPGVGLANDVVTITHANGGPLSYFLIENMVVDNDEVIDTINNSSHYYYYYYYKQGGQEVEY